MTRSIQRLSPLTIQRPTKQGYLADGAGLYFRTSQFGTKGWIFRYSLNGRRREMGLGPYPAVSLAVARQAAAECRTSVKTGLDPIDNRKEARSSARLQRARALTFDQAAARFIDSHETGWRNDKHKQQWRNTLTTYASPTVGNLAVAAVGTTEVMRILEPLWRAKPETASRVRGRIERVLDWAKARGYRDGENPARWRGHLDKLLPARGKVRRVQHHPAAPIDAVSTIYGKLCDSKGMAALALRFVILTAARAGEVTGARWGEIDLEAGVWTVPADRIKAGKEHRVSLSPQALAILRGRGEGEDGDLVFPGGKLGKSLSLTSLSKALAQAGGGDATVHGFRSTFRDWAAERTNFSREVSEMALAHVIGDKVEAAYRRGDLFTKRTKLMQAWSSFATTTRRPGEVVPLRRVA